MIKLYQFPPGFGMRTASPFGLKLEAYMKLAGIDYEVVHEGDPRKAPKGKIPYIVDEGQDIGDSGFIIEHLIKKYGDKVDAGLSPEQRAVSHFIRKTVEENLYFVVVYQRWFEDQGFEHMRPMLMTQLPPVIGGLIASMIRGNTKKTLVGQGMGRHAAADVDRLGVADADMLIAYLGDKPFFLGDEPHAVDAAVLGLLLGVIQVPIESAFTKRVRSSSLNDFCTRMMDRCFPKS